MTRIVSDEENLQQLGRLWDMYENGVNSKLFLEMVEIPSDSLLEDYPSDGDFFYHIMANFIINYRKAYSNDF